MIAQQIRRATGHSIRKYIKTMKCATPKLLHTLVVEIAYFSQASFFPELGVYNINL